MHILEPFEADTQTHLHKALIEVVFVRGKFSVARDGVTRFLSGVTNTNTLIRTHFEATTPIHLSKNMVEVVF